jgi:UDP-4-amino-4,6-dideoxy-N-acetyl-beta-L-altrosamine transaminase/dTDP-4-dehydrorhamnose reductase
MNKKRLLITGVSGLLGNNLAFCLKDSYEILGVYHSHRIQMDGIGVMEADMTCGDGLNKQIADFDPDIIVHCAAQANVDMCEDYPLEAEKANVLAPKYLIKSITKSSCKFVYISTDLVYDGIKGDFTEQDPVGPPNVYGRTKYEGELEALKRKNSLVLRTNFFGWNILEDKFSLGEWVIHELSQQHKIEGFTDCQFSSIYTFELAKLLDLCLKKDISGIYNLTSSSSLSKYDFLCQIAKKLSLDARLIEPISIDRHQFKAKRSKKLDLNVGKLAKALAVTVPSIEYSIEQFVKDYKKGLPERFKSFHRQNIYPASLPLITYGRQVLDDNDIAVVKEVLQSGPLTQGPMIPAFESALLEVSDATHAVAVNSGTAALHIACMTAALGPGDEVITSPNTFVASANCVVYCGGKPVFADIDPRTYNISPREIEKKINERTKAVIPVHFAGQSCDMEDIRKVVKAAEKKYGHKIFIIEDASHALGSYYKGAKVGSCVYSDMTTMSFHPVKHITTAEGGVVLTNDEKLSNTLRKLRSHGITGDDSQFVQERPGPWYYEQQLLGYNYRITDVLCAMGISQLKKLGRFAQRRKEIIRRYNQAFKGVEGITIPYEDGLCDSNFHLYVLRFNFRAIGITRAQLMTELKNKGIQTQVHYIPVYSQPFYRQHFGDQSAEFPAAEDYYAQCLSIPLHPQLTLAEQDLVVSSIRSIMEAQQQPRRTVTNR